ncbi:hypothetical protein [Defluviimonas sp. SAOS-178_SWC]|uniref:hypothetical protein n=1 Tax=Defluviimonas sp. SAOS-178_SWC TaxID=3121287 RepID=UPI0032220003
MENRAIGNAATIVALLASTAAASAATISFSALPDEGALSTTYTENGITATAGSGTLGWYTAPGTAHVDDAGTGFTSDITFTTGGIFDATSFTLTSLGYNFLNSPGTVSDNILVAGYVGGSLVAGANYTLSAVAGTVQTILLGSAFTAIDAFTISLLYPRTGRDCDAPCGHFDLNSVTLDTGPAPVPLPPAAPLMGAAVLGLFALRRRRGA